MSRNLESDAANPSLADRIAAVLAEHRETHISGLCSCGTSYPNEHDKHQAEQVTALFEQMPVRWWEDVPVVRWWDVPIWRLRDA